MKDYLSEAAQTMSTGFHEELVSHEVLVDTLERAILALKDIDQIKKALFYGRAMGARLQFEETNGRKNNIKTETLHSDRQSGIDILHGIIGVATESGEMLEALQKALMGQGLDLVNLAEEIGDQFWYDAAILRVIGQTFEDVQKRNIEKLRARFPNRFTEYDANNRNLAAEREILEAPMKKQEAFLDNWTILGNVAFGDVVNHPLLGTAFGRRTSTIKFTKEAHLYKEGDILETKNTIYKLGKKVIPG